VARGEGTSVTHRSGTDPGPEAKGRRWATGRDARVGTTRHPSVAPQMTCPPKRASQRHWDAKETDEGKEEGKEKNKKLPDDGQVDEDGDGERDVLDAWLVLGQLVEEGAVRKAVPMHHLLDQIIALVEEILYLSCLILSVGGRRRRRRRRRDKPSTLSQSIGRDEKEKQTC